MFGRATHQTKALTSRQRLVLDLILAGRTNPEIAEELGISLDGAKWHVSEAFNRLGVASREEAARTWARIRSEERRQRVILAMVTSIVCVSAAGGIAVGAMLVNSALSREPDAGAAVAEPFVCPVTIPSQPYFASAPYPAEPPAYYESTWYGSDDLWTMLKTSGAIDPVKYFWWSRNYEGEDSPHITVTATRLDGVGKVVAEHPTNASADFGRAMLVGIDIPSSGCWEIHAEYKSAELAYVVKVE